MSETDTHDLRDEIAAVPDQHGLCPGCGLSLNRPGDCERCEYFNLIRLDGRYHYCGKRECLCRNLPGLAAMHSEVRERFMAEHEARMARANGSES